MTKPSNNLEKQIDNLLDHLVFQHFPEFDAKTGRHGKIEYWKGGKVMDANEAIKQLVHQACIEARLDELEQLQKKHTRTYTQTVTDNNGDIYVNDTHSYISKYETQERIAALKEQSK